MTYFRYVKGGRRERRSCYPVLCSTDVERAARFWSEWFGYTTTFAADWYVSLSHEPGGHELALLDHTHSTITEIAPSPEFAASFTAAASR